MTAMERRTISEGDPGHETALLADAVINRNIAALYRGVSFARLVAAPLAGSEDGKERLRPTSEWKHDRYWSPNASETNPDVELAKEAVPALGSALEAIARKEAVGGKGEADVC